MRSTQVDFPKRDLGKLKIALENTYALIWCVYPGGQQNISTVKSVLSLLGDIRHRQGGCLFARARGANAGIYCILKQPPSLEFSLPDGVK